MKILVTGAAGFIGFYVSRRLLAEGHSVVGIDNINDYYDVGLKHGRLEILNQQTEFHFIQMDIADREAVSRLFTDHDFDSVIHLAAQAGVRYSIDNPSAYVDSNLVGFGNMLEGVRAQQTPHFVYASSSSVYGMNSKQPFAVGDVVDYPISLYAATKKSNELMAHTYSHLFNIPTTGLRFFTVYGPWGRPDMAYFKFAKAIEQGKPIDVYNQGKMQRDFTYIDDIVEGILRVTERIPETVQAPGSSATAPYKVYNIGNNNPVELEAFIGCIESSMGKQAVKNYLPMQAGDVPITFADVDDLMADVGFKPKTPLVQGIQAFVDWYKDYYRQ